MQHKGLTFTLNNVEYIIVHQTLNGYLCVDAIGGNKIIPIHIAKKHIKSNTNV